ncbi:hypothetical protein OC834_004190 [Tilletia horrida]|nr:hypothetical protein OC834_004190 [Tilletia horrida]
MVSLRFLLSSLLVGFAVAAPLQADSASGLSLVPRQNSNWNEPRFGKPYDFAAQKVSACSYQVTNRQFAYVSGYDIRFYATYPGSSKRVEIKNVAHERFILNQQEDIYSHVAIFANRFRGICSGGASGAEPTALYIRYTLWDTFRYKNDYISPAITPTNTTLPSAPRNIRATRVSTEPDSYVSSWDAVPGATGGYIVVIGYEYYFAYDDEWRYETTHYVVKEPKLNFTLPEANYNLREIKFVSRASRDVVTDILSPGRLSFPRES